MISLSNYWELLAVGVDSLIVYTLYRFYKNRGKEADIVSNTPSYEIGSELFSAVENAENKCLEYACVEGLTENNGPVLRSHFVDSVGVIQHQLFVEHKSKRTQGFWSDMRRIIRDVTNVQNFNIINSNEKSGQGIKIQVTDPLSAEYLMENLPVVYDCYQPCKDGLIARSVDRLLGEVTKGYQETEKMLGVGVQILGIGKISLNSKNLILEPPTDGHRYILTTMRKSEVIRSLRSQARTLRVFVWIFSLVGTGILAYWAYRHISKHIREARTRQTFEEIRQQLRSGNGGHDNGGSDDGANQCTVCLTNRRNVLIMNCRHVCVCDECAEALPNPKLCPVCRSQVDHFVPIFIS